MKTKARFASNKALQAYNPAGAQALPVCVPLEDLEEVGIEQIDGRGILALIHCFYLDESEEILRDLAALPLNLRMVLTTDTEKKADQLNALSQRSGLHGEVVVTPNRGRDVAPFLVEGARYLRGETITLHLHTKKSPHNSIYAGWGKFVRRNLVGLGEIVRSILRLLEQEEIGVVYSDHFREVRGLRNWGRDFQHARRLMKRLNVALTADSLLDFTTSTMFWAKTEALRPLFDLGLAYEDFEPEEGQIDGTLAHAIERCLLLVAERQGYRHIKVIAANESDAATAMSVSSRNISYMLRRHAPRLLEGPARGLHFIRPSMRSIR
jgi:lipopolysaccharide biosynthesis protein